MIHVRDAAAADVETLTSLMAVLGYPVSASDLEPRLDRVLRTGDRVLVAVESDGAVVGCAVVHVTPALHRPSFVGRVTMLAVAEAVQGRGVGRALMDAAEQHVRASGCERLEVTSSHKHADAHAFYRRLGYDNDGVRFAKRLV